MKQSYKTMALWAVLVVMLISFWQFFNNHAQAPHDLSYGDFLTLVEQGRVDDLLIKGQTYTGHETDPAKTEFRVTGTTPSDQLLDKLHNHKVNFRIDKEEANGLWLTLLIQGLPLAFLFLLFFFFMRQLQGSGGKAMSFGKSKAKLLSENHNKVTFNDVAGIDEAKGELEEIIDFLKDPKKFTRLGGRIPKGVLLMGPPGTGKTLLARAIAGEAGVPFFSISGSDFVEMFVGVGASRVRDLFEQGKKNAPCIVFIDEIDAVGRHRGAGLGGGHDEREQTLNQLLVEMDGFESNDGVILIAATNRPDVLDPALLRPGRFDRRIVVPRPDVQGRLGILGVHTKRTPLGTDVDLEQIARGTPGFSGADLENLVNEAALLAARQNKDKLDLADFEFAKDKVLMGVERKSMIISDKEKRVTATHESGHTLVAKLIPGVSDPVHKVTIIPRGPALGLMQQLPDEDRYNASREYATNRIAIALGGRVAEELVFNEITSGASNDIEQATDLARRMVCEWGMSEALGPLAFGKREEQVFLGRDMGNQQSYSEQTAQQIDSEVRRIVTDEYARVRKILGDNLESLKSLANSLLEYETLDGAEINTLLAGGTILREKPVKKVPPPRIQPERKEKQKILDALGGLPKLGEPSKA